MISRKQLIGSSSLSPSSIAWIAEPGVGARSATPDPNAGGNCPDSKLNVCSVSAFFKQKNVSITFISHNNLDLQQFNES